MSADDPGLASRLRLIVITDVELARPRTVVDVVRAAVRAGTPAVQLRDKRASAGELYETGRALLPIVRDAGALFFVNDRVDVALALGADGVHVGPDDVPVAGVWAAVRRTGAQGVATGRRSMGTATGGASVGTDTGRASMGTAGSERAEPGRVAPGRWGAGRTSGAPRFIVGASADDAETARRLVAEGADYIGCGTVYATATKADAGSVIGLEGLQRVVEAVSVPVVGIGGIDPARSAEVARGTGAAGVAVVGAVMGARDIQATVEALLAPWSERR